MKYRKVFNCFLLLAWTVCGFTVNGQTPNLQDRLITEINNLRNDPAAYYLKYQWFLDGNEHAASYFRFAKPAKPLAWQNQLYQAAKYAAGNNYTSDGGFTNSFCLKYQLAADAAMSDSLVHSFILRNFQMLLSPDFNVIGIYVSKATAFSCCAYIGSKCPDTSGEFKYKAEQYVIDSSKIDFKKLDTGAKCSYMSSDEKEMLKNLNFARCYPQIFAQVISNWRNELSLSYEEYMAVVESIDEMKSQKSLPPLLPDEKLYKVAKGHGQYMNKTGVFAHAGAGNSTFYERIEAVFGDIYSGENLVRDYSPVQSVMVLLIDWGIDNITRGHRSNIFNAEFTHVGCYFAGDVGTDDHVYVQDFAKLK